MTTSGTSPAPLRVLIVDDEALSRARTRRLLDELTGTSIVGEAASVDEAARVAAATAPELILLDIQMPGEDGFALLPRLTGQPAIVFVTAFDHYAVRAFEAHAVDYLLKPFRKERLAEALERARRDLARPEELTRRLAELLAMVGAAAGGAAATGSAPAGGAPVAAGASGLAGAGHEPTLDRLTVRVGAKQIILRAEEVLWFGAEDKLVFAATAKDRHYVNFTLDQLERRLDPGRFVRVHRSAIVNLDHAAALRPGFAGTYTLTLRDEERTEVPVARARARMLRERLGA
jgi:two-component system LytT family response regulator